jgi:hypothetical protein
VQQVLGELVPGLNMYMMQDSGKDGLIIIWSGPRSCLVTLRAFRDHSTVSLTIEYYRGEDEPALVTFEVRPQFIINKIWFAYKGIDKFFWHLRRILLDIR